MQETNWVAVREYWLRYRPTLQQLADRFDISLSAVKSRKTREKWGVATKGKKVATNGEKVATNKKRAKMYRKKKTPGNPNPKVKFKKGNQAAFKHGLYAKLIPEETLELAGEINARKPTELLWEQILLQYAAIIRAQRIMFVEDENDDTQFVKKEMRVDKSEDGESETWIIEYDNIGAWEKQSSFMLAMTRATSELRNLIKQYVSISDEADERRLKLEAMQTTIERNKAELERISKGDTQEPLQIEVIRK